MTAPMEPNLPVERRTGVLRQSGRSVVTAALLAVAVAAPLAASPSAAQQPDGGLRVDAVAGFEGRYLVGRRVPVVVSIHADRLVRGAVEVTVEGMSGTWSTPVEVPGGSDKLVVVVVPTSSTFVAGDAEVRLVFGGEPITVAVELQALESEEIVGLLPGVIPADLPEPFAFPQAVGTARFAELTEDLLAIPGAIDPLGTVIAAPEELGRLDAGARASVLDWIDRGGRLVVDGTTGPIAGLPDTWQPGTSGRVRAGLGEVRLSGGRAAAGDWAQVLEPTPTASNVEMQRLGGGAFVGQFDLFTELGRDAGLNALDLPWLLAFLGAYVVLVGPVAWFVLRRRRPSLGWVVIPALAIGFTGLAFVVGSDLRSGTTTTHGTVLELSAAGTRATTVVGTVSRSGGDGTARFPEGWTASGIDTSMFGIVTGNAPAAFTSNPAGSDARIPLTAGAFGVVRGSGPLTDTPAALTVSAVSEDGEVHGTVTNESDFTIERIGVFLGRAGERVADLAPGESATFELSGDEFAFGDPWTPAEAQLWPNESGWNGGFDAQALRASAVNLPLLSDVMGTLGPNAHPRGMVTVVGWTRDLAAAVEISGGEPTGRSAIVARASVQGIAGELVRGAALREIIRGPQGTDLPDDRQLGRAEGLVWRFTVPAGTGDVPLSLSVPAYVPRIDVWDGTAWQTVDSTPFNANDDFARIRIVDLPAAGLLGDTVLLRGFLMTDFGPGSGDGIDLFSEVAA